MGALAIPLNFAAAQEEEGAQQGSQIFEEIIVTAQRVAEDAQDVPLSVSALTEGMIEDQQIITPSDLQMNAPSVSFTPTNFGGFNFSIRGIGSLVAGSASEPGVSAHLNEITMVSNLNSTEFYDLARVEVLRGPQGTLFGRNATGGAINFVTNKPEYDSVESYIDLEMGAYSHVRGKAMLNLPLGQDLALRVSGFYLQRDGYTENLAAGKGLYNLNSDIDGRDMYSMRATLGWDFDVASMWFMYQVTEEDSDRARITNQICDTNDLPTTGCSADGFGFGVPHLGATTGGIFGGAVGAIPLGLRGTEPQIQYDHERPAGIGYRAVHTDFEPVFEEFESIYAFGYVQDVGDFTVDVLGAVRDSEYLSQQDYNFDVGPTLGPTPLNPTGFWPTSRPSGDAGQDWTPGECNINAGTAGVFGGCVRENLDDTRIFSYDQSDGKGNFWTLETKVRSNFDTQVNFLAGLSVYGSARTTDYYVISNTLDLVGLYGAPAFGLPPLYPTYFVNSASPEGDGGRTDDGTAVFGEVYFDMNDRTSLTFGLRYNEDNKETSDTSVLFNSQNHLAILPAVYEGIRAVVAAAIGVPPEFVPLELALGGAYQLGLLDPSHLSNLNAASGAYWSRTLNLLLGPFASGDPEVELARYYGVTQDEIDAALLTPAYSAARVAISNRVPIVPQFGETRALTNSPSDGTWTAITGRASIDYELNDNMMVYGSLSKGYKPGGLNAAIPQQFQDTSSFTFLREDVIAAEAGIKSLLLEGNLKMNGAFFVYDYNNLQVTYIRNNSAINENIDAGVWGFDLEGVFLPAPYPNISIDYSYGFLNTSIKDSLTVDPTNRTAGQSDWILLKNIDPGSLTGVGYVARESQLTQLVVDTALAAGATADIRNGLTPVSVSYPANEAGVSIPSYFSRNFLTAFGVETSDGIAVNLDGNSLPSSPQHSIKVGFEISRPMQELRGSLTLRVDGYWQSETYAREFNTVGDEIDAWSQMNTSVIYRSDDGRLNLRGWVRNLLDENNVTGHYLTSDTSGFFRNYFLTEPRIWGVSVRYAMGGS